MGLQCGLKLEFWLQSGYEFGLRLALGLGLLFETGEGSHADKERLSLNPKTHLHSNRRQIKLKRRQRSDSIYRWTILPGFGTFRVRKTLPPRNSGHPEGGSGRGRRRGMRAIARAGRRSWPGSTRSSTKWPQGPRQSTATACGVNE